jgi:hypothetical protein
VAAVTKAYKFLTGDGLGVFSRFAWPLPNGGPGAWMEAEVEACRSGIHACRPVDLPYWLAPVLYEIELGGPVDAVAVKLVAPRGRLIRRVDAWNGETRDEYSRMCIARAHELVAGAVGLEDWAPPPSIGLWEAARLGFITARIAEQLGGIDAHLEERRRQSDWLVERLALG